MEISGLSGAAINTGALEKTKSILGKEDFLTLLVTQLSNQDPLNPLEGQEFAAQLAQFSSVEALLNIETALEMNTEISALLAQSTNSGVAAGLIGKSVTAESNHLFVRGGGEVPVSFDLASPAASTVITIKNEGGAVVRTITSGAKESGQNTVSWDGKNDAGDQLPDGNYTFDVTGTDINGETIATTTYTKGVVDRVSFTAEGILLWIDDVSFAMSTVTSVGLGDADPAN